MKKSPTEQGPEPQRLSRVPVWIATSQPSSSANESSTLKRSKAGKQSGNAWAVPPVAAPRCRHAASVQFVSNVFQPDEACRLDFMNCRQQGLGARIRSPLCR
jgi:hypothetical protein